MYALSLNCFLLKHAHAHKGEVNSSVSQLYSTSTSLKSSLAFLEESDKDKSYMAPHVLAMSATPIPRTLALALFGDMSLTQVNLMFYVSVSHVRCSLCTFRM